MAPDSSPRALSMAPPLAACSAWFSPSLMGGWEVSIRAPSRPCSRAAGFIALVLVPELKYPANPPAIGAGDDDRRADRALFRHARHFPPGHDPGRDARPIPCSTAWPHGTARLPRLPSSSRWRASLPSRCRPSMRFRPVFRRMCCGIFAWRRSARGRSYGGPWIGLRWHDAKLAAGQEAAFGLTAIMIGG